MKILIVAERYWPEVGAAPSRLGNMAEGLLRQGCEVDVLTSLPNYPQGRIFDGYRGRLSKYEQHRGIGVFRYWIYATVSRSPLARIVNMFSLAVTLWLFAFKRRRIQGYDTVIIQTPTLVVAASAMLLFKGLYGKRCVLNVSDIWPLTAVDMGAMRQYSASYRFMAWLEHYLYRKADGVLGQSEEILNHVAQELLSLQGQWDDAKEKDTDEVLHADLWRQNPHLFLYRNFQPRHDDGLQVSPAATFRGENRPLRLVFCGMLGVAQNVAGIVKRVPFRQLGVEFHVIGGGRQLQEIEDYCQKHPGCGVFTHGFVAKEQLNGMLQGMDASIVPLTTRIRGAFPSKVFDILPHGLPVIYCGGGEAAAFIDSRQVGLTCAPGDYVALTTCIKQLRDMSDRDFLALSERCQQLGRTELDFDRQMKACREFLNVIK